MGTVALTAVFGYFSLRGVFGKGAGRAAGNAMNQALDSGSDAGRMFSRADDVVGDVVETAAKRDSNATQLKYGGCFVAGTQVKVRDGSKSIEQVKAGDYVYAKNTETGECDWKRVVRVFVHQKTELIHIRLENEQIDTTTEHPFWVAGYGFKATEDLLPGEYVENADGELLRVISVEKEYLDEPVTVYNFEVEDWHTYYVSEEEVLVHNMCALASGSTGGLGPDEFYIDDWTGYPDAPKPTGPFRILEGAEYEEARTLANRTNAKIHRNRQDLKGSQIHEMHPVKLGGSPTDIDNKIALPPKEHAKYTTFWNKVLREQQKGK